ncbi:hypothetical protein [Clostridium sp.]|uniref:hypothetical protein n=1 Tax=Clostridium sp. TaxID=1506 RepID=UPI003217D23E
MSFDFLKELRATTTKEEFEEVLKIVTQDIMFNNVSFNRLTKAEDLMNVCRCSLSLIRGVQAYGND